MEQEREWLNEALAALGQPPSSDSAWKYCRDQIQGESDAAYWAEMIEAFTNRPSPAPRTGRRKRPDDGNECTASDPKSWDAYRRRLFAPFTFEVRWTRARLNLREKILAPEQVAPYLREQRERELQQGDVLRLWVPVVEGDDYTIEEWKVYRGYKKLGRVDTEPTQPLAELAHFAQRVATRTGVHPADAVLYLLADDVVYWPSASASVEWRPRFAIVVRLEWPFANPKVVSDLFTRLRGSLYLQPSASDEECRVAGTRAWSMELLQFVSERHEAGVPWKKIHEDWNHAYPDKPFKTWASLRRSYEEASKPDSMSDVMAGQSPAWRLAPENDLGRHSSAT
jgi:hypothetical protein